MILYTALLAALSLRLCEARNTEDYSQYVEPLLGTEGGGNMFPGASRPLGVVKLGPDLYSGTDAYSGYLAEGYVFGFSMTHESGTGGAPKYGVVSQMPWVGNISNPLVKLWANRTQPDEARVGYYRTTLNNNVTVELAATDHAGMYRYKFDQTEEVSNIVVDVSHVLKSYRGQGLGQNYTYGGIEVFQDGHYETNGSYNQGWNMAPEWTIYSCGRFNQYPINMTVFKGQDNTTANLTWYGEANAASGSERLGAVFTFPPNTEVVSRVGISFISAQQACNSLDNEIPAGKRFYQVVDDTAEQWNTEILSKVSAPDASDNDKRLLYTMLYGAFLIPTNKTNENPKWSSSEPYYDDTFTLWDLHRCSNALWQVLHPTFYEEYIRSLIDIWRYDGYLPDGRSSNFNGRTQGGSNGDNVLADAYVKGVRGSINWEDGYAAMVKDAEVTPENNFDPMAPTSSTKEGRGALPDWIEYGYITPNFSRAVSTAVEYSVNDYALSQVAFGLGKEDEGWKYLARGRNWRNHWNPDSQSLGFNGFLVPRNANGTFVDQDPLDCAGCYWEDAYYQALPWEYSWGATHDVATLVNYTGGPERFVERLDKMFEPGQNPGGSEKFNFTINNPSNEPDFAVPYLYNFAGRQDLATKQSRYIAKTFYTRGNTGLPGNSDAGAMQTWWLWNVIGLYPLTATPYFLIHSPWFSLDIDLGDGKKLVIKVQGGDSDSAYYVQSLKVNGKDWKKNWCTWDDIFANGSTMEYVLGEAPSTWFEGGGLPPSPGS